MEFLGGLFIFGLQDDQLQSLPRRLPLTGNRLLAFQPRICTARVYMLEGGDSPCLDHSSLEHALHTVGMWVTLELIIVLGKTVPNGYESLVIAHGVLRG